MDANNPLGALFRGARCMCHVNHVCFLVSPVIEQSGRPCYGQVDCCGLTKQHGGTVEKLKVSTGDCCLSDPAPCPVRHDMWQTTISHSERDTTDGRQTRIIPQHHNIVDVDISRHHRQSIQHQTLPHLWVVRISDPRTSASPLTHNTRSTCLLVPDMRYWNPRNRMITRLLSPTEILKWGDTTIPNNVNLFLFSDLTIGQAPMTWRNGVCTHHCNRVWATYRIDRKDCRALQSRK